MLIDAVTESYNKFFFGDVGRETYDFFWGDFADWYIEASKARLYHSGDDSVALVAQALPNRKEAHIISTWPQTFLPRNTTLVKRFENLQALEEKEVLALLSRLDLDNINFIDSPPGMFSLNHISFGPRMKKCFAFHLVASEGLEAYLPLADMVDISAEVQCLTKRLSKIQTEYEGLKAHLKSPKFIEKAPEDIVCGVQEKATEAEEKINLTNGFPQINCISFKIGCIR
ncbi:hypothetical protein CRYUN_Cryun01aG0102600 [Craigia yunnanensis]